jgi:hypothetical protein
MKQWVGNAHGDQAVRCLWGKKVGRFDFRGGWKLHDLQETRVVAGMYARLPETIIILLLFGSILTLGGGGLKYGFDLSAQPCCWPRDNLPAWGGYHTHG